MQDAAASNANEIQTSVENNISVRISACMYYHYSEIGRSANTAHVLEAILERRAEEVMPVECSSLIFGDSLAEAAIVDQMKPINQLLDDRNGKNNNLFREIFSSLS